MVQPALYRSKTPATERKIHLPGGQGSSLGRDDIRNPARLSAIGIHNLQAILAESIGFYAPAAT